MDHPDFWEKGRDLALLALVTYPRKADRKTQENQIGTPTPTAEGN